MYTILLIVGGVYVLMYALDARAKRILADDPNYAANYASALANSEQPFTSPPPAIGAKTARRNVYSDMHAHQNVIPLKHA